MISVIATIVSAIVLFALQLNAASITVQATQTTIERSPALESRAITSAPKANGNVRRALSDLAITTRANFCGLWISGNPFQCASSAVQCVFDYNDAVWGCCYSTYESSSSTTYCNHQTTCYDYKSSFTTMQSFIWSKSMEGGAMYCDEEYGYCGTYLIRGYPEYSKYYCTDKSYATVVSLFNTTTEASMADVTAWILTLPAAVASTSSQAAASTSSSPPTTLSQSSSHKNVPAIVGGTVGTILGLALIGAVVFLVLQRKNHLAKESLGAKESSFKVLGSNIGEVSNSNVLGSPQVTSTTSRNNPHSSFNDLNRTIGPPPHEGRYHAYSRSFNAESNIPYEHQITSQQPIANMYGYIPPVEADGNATVRSRPSTPSLSVNNRDMSSRFSEIDSIPVGSQSGPIPEWR